MMLSVSVCSATSTFPASVVHCSWSSSATGHLGEAMGSSWKEARAWSVHLASGLGGLQTELPKLPETLLLYLEFLWGQRASPRGRQEALQRAQSSMCKELLSAQSYFPLSLLLPLPHPCRQENPANTWLGILLGTGGGWAPACAVRPLLRQRGSGNGRLQPAIGGRIDLLTLFA